MTIIYDIFTMPIAVYSLKCLLLSFFHVPQAFLSRYLHLHWVCV